MKCFHSNINWRKKQQFCVSRGRHTLEATSSKQRTKMRKYLFFCLFLLLSLTSVESSDNGEVNKEFVVKNWLGIHFNNILQADFCMKVFCTAFLSSQFGFGENFGKISQKFRKNSAKIFAKIPQKFCENFAKIVRK